MTLNLIHLASYRKQVKLKEVMWSVLKEVEWSVVKQVKANKNKNIHKEKITNK